MLLMPVNEKQDIYDILANMQIDSNFKRQVYTSVKKIIRLKICLSLIQNN